MNLFKLPTTGTIDFEKSLETGHGDDKWMSPYLNQATTLRGRVRAQLKEAKRTEMEKGDYGLVVVKVCVRPDAQDNFSENLYSHLVH